MEPEKPAEVQSWLKKAASDLRGADIDLAVSLPEIKSMSSKTEKLINEMTEIIVREVDPKQVILFGSPGHAAARFRS
jgi:hypothetical protein